MCVSTVFFCDFSTDARCKIFKWSNKWMPFFWILRKLKKRDHNEHRILFELMSFSYLLCSLSQFDLFIFIRFFLCSILNLNRWWHCVAQIFANGARLFGTSCWQNENILQFEMRIILINNCHAVDITECCASKIPSTISISGRFKVCSRFSNYFFFLRWFSFSITLTWNCLD